MRFYIGFGKRFNFKKIIKWIIPILLGLLAFFGIDNIKPKALTDTQAPSAVKRCNYNGLFTDSNCITETPYNCTLSGLSSPFSCYVPDNNNDNIKLDSKSIWYSYTNSSSSSGDCNTSQKISLYVDVILNDQITANGYTSPTASDGPFVANALDYNAWNAVTPTTRGGLTKAASSGFMNLYWKYLDNANSKNKTGLKIYGFSSSTGYQLGNCNFISYGTNKTVRFLCTAPAKMTTYYIGQNIYNNGGGLGTSSTYARNAQYISNVSDPCSVSGNDMGSVTSSINNQTSQMMEGFSSIIENNNNNTQQIADGLDGVQGAIDGLTDGVNSATEQIIENQEDLKDKQDETNEQLGEINDNTTSCQDDTFYINNNPYDSNVGYLLNTGVVYTQETSYRYTDYIKLGKKSNLVIKASGFGTFNPSYCLYSSNKSLLGCTRYTSDTNYTITDSNAYYIRLSYNVSNSSYYVKLVRCSGMGDYIGGSSDTSKAGTLINNLLDQIQDYIDETPIANLITMPITLLTKIQDSISVSSCSPYNLALTLPGNNTTNISYSCPDYNSLLGNTGAALLDAFMCFGLCWGIAHACIHFYEELTSLKDTFDMQYKGAK